MSTGSRLGTWLLLAGGTALTALMLYTLSLGGPRRLPGDDGPADAAEVAVFFPDRADWLDFRLGIAACVRKGLVDPHSERDDRVIVTTPQAERAIRFTWHRSRGVLETREAVARLVAGPRPPVAVVGSINTALTAALAEGLRTAAPADGPPLLVPWATSVETDDPARGPGPFRLLDLDPGRTFRFCLNNQREADLVVRCLAAQPGEPLPERVIIAADRRDPYSLDLASCFRRVIRTVAPEAEILEQPGVVGPPTVADRPAIDERRWAASIWREITREPRPTWVILPLQAQPAARLLSALREEGADVDPATSPLRVLCGDGFGLSTLVEFTSETPKPFSLWCASASSGGVPGVERDAQVPAEIVSALALGLDRGKSRDGSLAAFLNDLVIPADGRAAFGRSLAFDDSGERRGADLGNVLAILPGHREILAFSHSENGSWSRPAPVASPTVVARP
jgi:hypothetical protein